MIAESGINGNYKISGLTAGTYELQVWKPCYVAKKEIVSIEEDVPKVLNIQLRKDTTFECPPEWQGYNPSDSSDDLGWYLNQPSKGIFAEDLPMNAEFILTGIPPGCCPCPPCDDCPGGVWIPVIAPQISGALIVGKEGGYVIYNCLTVMPPLYCRGWYHCTIIGLIGGLSIGVADAIVTGAPCVEDLEGKARGIIIAPGLFFPVGITLLWGSSFYGEVNIGVPLIPGVPPLTGVAYIRCKTEKLKCKGPCPEY